MRIWLRANRKGHSEDSTAYGLQEISEDLGKPIHLMCFTNVKLHATEMCLDT